LALEEWTGRLFRNVSDELPLYTALYPRRARISSTSRRKPEIKHKFIESRLQMVVFYISQRYETGLCSWKATMLVVFKGFEV